MKKRNQRDTYRTSDTNDPSNHDNEGAVIPSIPSRDSSSDVSSVSSTSSTSIPQINNNRIVNNQRNSNYDNTNSNSSIQNNNHNHSSNFMRRRRIRGRRNTENMQRRNQNELSSNNHQDLPPPKFGGNNSDINKKNDSHSSKLNSNSSRVSRSETVSTASMSLGGGSLSTMSMVARGGIMHGMGSLGRGLRRGTDRNRRRRRPPRPSRDLFNRQLQLLSSISGASAIFFLFFFLNIFAFTALMTGLVSTLMLFYTISNYISFIFNQGGADGMGGQGALFEFLPQSIQDYLMNTSIHDSMLNSDSFLENRWYLLYLIPGLSPEQITSMVNRLPQRHRNAAFGQGGAARLLLPDSVYNLITPPNTVGEQRQHRHPPAIEVDHGHQHHQSQDSSLPVIVENDEEEDQVEEVVTMQDAFHGLFNDARTLVAGNNTNNGNNQGLDSDVSFEGDDEVEVINVNMVHPDLSWGSENIHASRSDESSDAHLSLHGTNTVTNSGSGMVSTSSEVPDDYDLSWDESQDLYDEQLDTISSTQRISRPTPLNVREQSHASNTTDNSLPSTVVTRSSMAILDHGPRNIQLANEEETVEAEQEIENEILNEAFSTMINNYTNSASSAALSVVRTAVDRVAPMVMRFGFVLSSISSVGLMGLYSPAVQRSIVRSNSTSRNLSNGIQGRSSRTEQYLVTGLSSTLLMGAISVGTAYAARTYTRRVLINKKEGGKDEQDQDKE